MNVLDQALVAIGIDPAFGSRIVATVAVLVAWVLVLRLVRRVLARTVDDISSRFSIVKATSYVVGIIAVVIIARLWSQGIAGIGTYLGLLSAGIAIALQDLISNLAGWLFIIIRRPFRVGDRIQIGGHAGDVVDIRPFRFVMLEIGHWVQADQSTGRLLHIPNGWVFKNSVANYDAAFGYIWAEMEVTVTFESDWRKAKRALEAIVGENAERIEPDVRRQINEAAETLHIQFTKLTPVVWTRAAASGVCLTARFLCKARQRRSSESAIWERILDAFAEMPDVDLAYPTTRFFEHAAEGKTVTAEHDVALKGRASSPDLGGISGNDR